MAVRHRPDEDAPVCRNKKRCQCKESTPAFIRPKMLTFLPLEEIEKMEQWQGSELNKAKEILAYELTKLVHGEEEAEKAQTASRNLFAGGGVTGDIPTTTYALSLIHI